MTINPATYWRRNKEWKKLMGKKGKVLFSTRVRVATMRQEKWTPYSFVLVDIEGKKYEMMGTGKEELKSGDKIVCVLRRLSEPTRDGLIEYGIKARKGG